MPNADIAFPAGKTFVANQLDADGTYVVWINSVGSVRQVTAAGGAIVTVAQQSVTGAVGNRPVLTNGTVAFVGMGSGSIYTVPEGQVTASAQAIVPSGYDVSYLALDPSASTAFLVGRATASPNQTYLLRCPLNGMACASLGGLSSASDLRVNTTYAFFSGSSSTSINSYNFTNSATRTVNTASVSSLAIDGSNVYWVGGAQSDTIYSLPQSFATGAMPQNLASNPKGIRGLASDGTNAYFGELNIAGNASLYYVPVGGGSPTTMYTSGYDSAISGEGYVVTAGGAVYWADVDFTSSPTTSKIMGIAAP